MSEMDGKLAQKPPPNWCEMKNVYMNVALSEICESLLPARVFCIPFILTFYFFSFALNEQIVTVVAQPDSSSDVEVEIRNVGAALQGLPCFSLLFARGTQELRA